MRTRTILLTSITSLAATLAVAQDVGQHPAVVSPRALPGVNPSTFVVGHPASPKAVAGHANYEHPAVTVSREAPGRHLDTNAYLVQPPATVEWTVPGAAVGGPIAATR